MVDGNREAKLLDKPARFCEETLGFIPTSYQRKLLEMVEIGNKRIVLRWARQSDKSWILAALMIWFCSTRPNRLALIVASGLRRA